MKKKITSIISLLLCAALALSLTACSGVSRNEKKQLEDAFYDTVMGGYFDEEAVEKVTDFESDSEDIEFFYDTQKKFTYILNKGVDDAEALGYEVTDAEVMDIDNDGVEEVFIVGFGDVEGKKTVACCDYMELPESLGGGSQFTVVAKTDFDEKFELSLEVKDGKVHLVAPDYDFGVISKNGAALEFSNYSPMSVETQEKDMSIFLSNEDLAYKVNGKDVIPGEDFCYYITLSDLYFKISTLEKITGVKISDDFKNAGTFERMTIYGEDYIHLLYIPTYFDLVAHFGGNAGVMVFMTEDYAAAHPDE